MIFISPLNFGQNYFAQLRWNWFSVRLPALMLGIVIYFIQHSRAMLERGVCELALFLSFKEHWISVKRDEPFMKTSRFTNDSSLKAVMSETYFRVFYFLNYFYEHCLYITYQYCLSYSFLKTFYIKLTICEV